MKKILIALAGVALLVTSSHANSTLVLHDGVNADLTITDTDGDGVVSYNGAFGNWIINVTTGIGSPPVPVIGTITSPYLHLNSVNTFIQSASGPLVGTTLTMTYTDDNNLTTGGPGLGPLTGNLRNEVGGTATGTTESVTSLVNGAAVASAQTFSGSPFSGTQVAAISGGAGSTMGIRVVVTAAVNGGTMSLDSQIITAPDAGMTLALLGSALTGMALFARRKTA
jgi:hypothetical protein